MWGWNARESTSHSTGIDPQSSAVIAGGLQWKSEHGIEIIEKSLEKP
jgi:hypothetical protein